MNKRWNIISGLLLIPGLVGLLVVPVSQANEMKRVIILETMLVKAVLDHTHWFVTQLKEMGYEEGKNLDLIILKAEGDRGRAVSLLENAMAEGRPDLVVTNATLASQEAAKILEGKGIPQIFLTVSDPVGAGLIKEVGVPTGTHITGKVHAISRTTRIDMVMRMLGQAVKKRPIRFGYIFSSYPSSVGELRELNKVAMKRDDVVFIPYQLEYKTVPEGLPAMMKDVLAGIAELQDRVDFWWEPSGPLGETNEYTDTLIANSRIPIAFGTKLDSVKRGTLLHITPNMEDSGRETAMLADAILKGADPGTIPPNPPGSFTVGVNLATALQYKIVIPPDILDLAGEHIYR